jgi:hypothetical protein
MYVYSNDDGYRSSDNDYNDDDDNNNICNSSSSSSSSSSSYNASPASDASKYVFSEDRFGRNVAQHEQKNTTGQSLFNDNVWHSVNQIDDNIDDIFAKLDLDATDASSMGHDVDGVIVSIELLIKYIDEFCYQLKKLPTEDNRFNEARNNTHNTYHILFILSSSLLFYI